MTEEKPKKEESLTTIKLIDIVKPNPIVKLPQDQQPNSDNIKSYNCC